MSSEDMTEDAIRDRHQPPEKYRISCYTYAHGTKFDGAMRAGTLYVLAGSFRWIGATTSTLREGDVASVPEGSYEMEVIGDDDLRFISVWKLPEEFWS